MNAKWAFTECVDCRGYGHVAAYTPDGSDFDGEKECSTCHGGGRICVSENDRLAVYPGQPFLGSAPGLYAKETQ